MYISYSDPSSLPTITLFVCFLSWPAFQNSHLPSLHFPIVHFLFSPFQICLLFSLFASCVFYPILITNGDQDTPIIRILPDLTDSLPPTTYVSSQRIVTSYHYITLYILFSWLLKYLLSSSYLTSFFVWFVSFLSWLLVSHLTESELHVGGLFLDLMSFFCFLSQCDSS